MVPSRLDPMRYFYSPPPPGWCSGLAARGQQVDIQGREQQGQEQGVGTSGAACEADDIWDDGALIQAYEGAKRPGATGDGGLSLDPEMARRFLRTEQRRAERRRRRRRELLRPAFPPKTDQAVRAGAKGEKQPGGADPAAATAAAVAPRSSIDYGPQTESSELLLLPACAHMHRRRCRACVAQSAGWRPS